jgi:AraC-like DNA-binding protein
VRNVAAAAFDQVVGRQPADGFVVRAHVTGVAQGEAPVHFVLSRRIERASALLDQVDLSLAAVAAAAGFASRSRFTTVFRKATGVTPGAWRRGLGL